MAMQINESYKYPGTYYEEQVKEKQAVERADKEKEEETKNSGKLSEPHDKYISSEKSEKKPVGLYWLGRDENGGRKIFFNDPKAACADGKKKKKAGGGQGEPDEVCVANTDRVDRDIRQLKKKRQELEQKIRSASGNERKIRELEKKLAQVEQELRRKDNDTYRRQHTVFSEQI